jgi:lysine-N-methylase
MATPVSQALGVDAKAQWLQPSYFDEFRCIGERCEDTCCQGMVIHIDQETFAKYQVCSHPDLKPKLEQLVQILPTPTPASYAAMRLENARCGVHQDGLCSIQSELGEDHLSHVCATYPRLLDRSGELQQRSLGLSCPEAARLALDRKEPVTIEGWTDSSESDARRLIISVLQDRRYSVSRRILLVAHICGKIGELYQTGQMSTLPQVVAGFALGIQAGFFDAHLNSFKGDAKIQLAFGLELLSERIRVDYTSSRFQKLYTQVIAALGLSQESTLDSLVASYQEIYEKKLVPFFEQHEYVLENFLVAQAFHQQFPFHAKGNVEEQFALVATYFLLAKLLLIGEATQQPGPLTTERAINVIQVLTRGVEHCGRFHNLVLDRLRDKGLRNIAGIAQLTHDLILPQRKAARR